MEQLLLDLLEFVSEEGRVCPKPRKWDALWKMLPGRKRAGGGWNPPLPLILAAWWDTTDWQKRDRLAEHIRYAYAEGVLKEVDDFLRHLARTDWLYEK